MIQGPAGFGLRVSRYELLIALSNPHHVTRIPQLSKKKPLALGCLLLAAKSQQPTAKS